MCASVSPPKVLIQCMWGGTWTPTFLEAVSVSARDPGLTTPDGDVPGIREVMCAFIWQGFPELLPCARPSLSSWLPGGWRWKNSVPVFKELAAMWESQTSKSIMTALHDTDCEPGCLGWYWNADLSRKCSPWFWEHFPAPMIFELSLEGEVRIVWGRWCVVGRKTQKGTQP